MALMHLFYRFMVPWCKVYFFIQSLAHSVDCVKHIFAVFLLKKAECVDLRTHY